MVSFIFKYALKKVFGETKFNAFGTEDPFFEEIAIEQKSWWTGRVSTRIERREKAIPAGLSKNDANILTRVKRRAYQLDMKYSAFGGRFGWNAILGIFPWVGDLITVWFSLMIFWEAKKVDGGLPWLIQGQFFLNILIDFLLGLIPIIGDLILVMYKANSRNALLLEKYLAEIGVQSKSGKVDHNAAAALVTGREAKMIKDEALVFKDNAMASYQKVKESVPF